MTTSETETALTYRDVRTDLVQIVEEIASFAHPSSKWEDGDTQIDIVTASKVGRFIATVTGIGGAGLLAFDTAYAAYITPDHVRNNEDESLTEAISTAETAFMSNQGQDRVDICWDAYELHGNTLIESGCTVTESFETESVGDMSELIAAGFTHNTVLTNQQQSVLIDPLVENFQDASPRTESTDNELIAEVQRSVDEYVASIGDTPDPEIGLIGPIILALSVGVLASSHLTRKRIELIRARQATRKGQLLAKLESLRTTMIDNLQDIPQVWPANRVISEIQFTTAPLSPRIGTDKDRAKMVSSMLHGLPDNDPQS